MTQASFSFGICGISVKSLLGRCKMLQNPCPAGIGVILPASGAGCQEDNIPKNTKFSLRLSSFCTKPAIFQSKLDPRRFFARSAALRGKPAAGAGLRPSFVRGRAPALRLAAPLLCLFLPGLPIAPALPAQFPPNAPGLGLRRPAPGKRQKGRRASSFCLPLAGDFVKLRKRQKSGKEETSCTVQTAEVP